MKWQICLSGSKRAKGWIPRKSVEKIPDGDAATVQLGTAPGEPPQYQESSPREPACSARGTAKVAEPLFPSTGALGVLVTVGAQAVEGMGWKAGGVGSSMGAAPLQHPAHGSPVPAITPARAHQVGGVALNLSGAWHGDAARREHLSSPKGRGLQGAELSHIFFSANLHRFRQLP